MKALYKIGMMCSTSLLVPQYAFAEDSQTGQEKASDPSDIVVTAQRRTERVQDVPISITVKSGAELENSGVVNVRNLQIVTPGLRQSSTQQAIATIRGVTTRQTDPGNDPNVALYIDGVYQSNIMVNNAELPDVNRIEVLKGPQGTLFGRNATGGAIRIFTKRPSFTPTGSLDVGYGNLNRFSAKGFISGPLAGDTVAASLSGHYERFDGYNRNVVDGSRSGDSHNEGARFKLLVEPSTEFSATLIMGYESRRDGNVESWTTFDGNGNSIGRAIDPVNAVIPTSRHEYASNVPDFLTSRIGYGSLEMSYETEAGTLSSITALSSSKYHTSQDADYSSLDLLNYEITVKQKDVSQELVFTSKRFAQDIMQVTAGAFYYHANGKYDPLIIFGGFIDPTLYGFMTQKTEAYSAFGEVDIEPTPRLHLIAGARYSIEKRDALATYVITPGKPDPLPALGNKTFKRFTPRVSIRYTFESDDNIYATFSQGFKSGGFNISSLQADPFRPEKLTAYEIGLKTSTRRRVSGTFAAFYYDYKDQQVQSFVNGLNVTTNAANAEMYGVDGELTIRPSDDLQLITSVAYLHARYKKFPDAVVNVPLAPGCFCGNMPIVTDLDGGRMPDAPTFTFGQTIAYSRDIGPGVLSLSGTAYHTSSYPIEFSDNFRQSAYWDINARAEFKPAGSNLTIYAWGRNLTDAKTVLAAFISEAGDGVVYNAPRTYGVGAKFSF